MFDVTTEDGRVLKLPYNVGEDTNWAAQRFVEKHNLPVKFLEKVSFSFLAFIKTFSSLNHPQNFSAKLKGEFEC